MAEFPATTRNCIDKLQGQCLIFLTGAAISIKRPDGVVVASWPYNCIRQFRAEDETGTFSFLSGRRGPFGVAEYVFELQEPILVNLQEALTQFTGAKFSQQAADKRRSTGGSVSSVGSSSVTSNSTYSMETFPQPSRRPLPNLPPKHQVMSASQLPSMTNGDHAHHAGRGPPTLPRYFSESAMGTSSPPSSSRPASAADLDRQSPSRDSWELKPDSYSSISARPIYFKDRPLPPSPTTESPTRPRMPPRVQTLSGIEARGGLVTAYGGSLSSPSSKHPLAGRKLPPSPPGDHLRSGRRDSEMSDVFSSDGTSDSTGTSPSADYSKTLPCRRGTAPDVTLHTAAVSPPQSTVYEQDTRHLYRQQTAPGFSTMSTRRHHYEETEMKPKGDRRSDPEPRSKPDPYDHLNLDGSQPSRPPPTRSHSHSPEVTSPQAMSPPRAGDRRSLSPRDDVSNLDFIPRSSPQVQHREISPEFAQHLAKFGQDPEKLVNLSTAVKGKRSPEMLKRRAQTIQGLNVSDSTYDSPRPAHPLNYPTASPEPARPQMRPQPGSQARQPYPAPDSLYQSPRSQPVPQETEAVYTNLPQGPRVNLYEDPREQIIDETDGDETEYHVPRPRDPNAPTNLYQVPPAARPRAPLETYDFPRSMAGSNSSDGAYNVPRAALQAHMQSQLQPEDNTYIFPRNDSDSALSSSQGMYNVPSYNHPRPKSPSSRHLYKIPRGTMSRQQIATGEIVADAQYEQIEDLPTARRLRPARSFESLFTRRVRPLQGDSGAPQERAPEVVSTRSNPYVDIDLNRTPPTQRRRSSASTSDAVASPLPENVYAEIQENPRFRYIAAQRPEGSQSTGTDEDHSIYHVPRPKTVAQPGVPLASSPQSPMYAVIPGDDQRIGMRVPMPHGQRAMTLSRDPTMQSQDLAKQGYELCLPAEESPSRYQSKTLPHGSTAAAVPTSPPRTVPRKNYREMVDKFGRQIPNGIRHRFSSDQTDQGGPPATELQSSSLPKDAGALTDEYVIITRSDPRQKSLPQDIPPQPLLRRESSADEYEVMTSVQVKLAKANGKSPPSPIREGGAAQVSPQREDEVPGLKLDGESPRAKTVTFAAVDERPRVVYTQATMDRDEVEEGWQMRPSSRSISEAVPVPHSKLVRIASGSPNDMTDSVNLRNRSRSFGNFLDRNRMKPHTYVNVPNDQLEAGQGEALPTRTMSTSIPENKRPMPLPKKPVHKSILLNQ